MLDKLKNEWENLGKTDTCVCMPFLFKTFSNYADELECISIYEYIADRDYRKMPHPLMETGLYLTHAQAGIFPKCKHQSEICLIGLGLNW